MLCRRCFTFGLCLALAGCHNVLVQYSSPMVASGAGNFIPDAGITYSPPVLVDGTVATFNIASGFGSKPNGALPLYWFPLDSNLIPHPTLSRTQIAPTPDVSSIIQSTIKPVNAVGAAQTRACYSTSPGRSVAPIIFTDPLNGTFTDCYIFNKCYEDHTVSGPSSMVFTGAISGTTLTVSGFPGIYTFIWNGSSIYGPGTGQQGGAGQPATGTKIVAPISGTGGNGTYQVNISQNLSSMSMNSPGMNLKSARMWDSSGPGVNGSIYWGTREAVVNEYAFFVQSASASTLYYRANTGGAPISEVPSTWHTCERIFRQSTLNTQDGYIDLWCDGLRGAPIGRSSVNPDVMNVQTNTTTAPNGRAQLFFDEYSPQSPAAGGDNLLDGFDYKHAIYVDDSQKRVMVSNESAISLTASTREICIPTAWSDTQIKCVIRQGALTQLSGQYLWAWTDINTQIRLGRWV